MKTVVDILSRFLLYPTGLKAQIKYAFLITSVNKTDRDVLHSIWYSYVSATNAKMIFYHFYPIILDLPSSPCLLNATLSRHIKKYQGAKQDVCAKKLNSLYFDDLSTGGCSVEEVYELSKIKEGFNLTKWNSISDELLKKAEKLEKSSYNNVLNSSAVEDEQSYAKPA